MATLTRAKSEFIEAVGLALEAEGLPRMAGRLLGALLVADPPEQSAEELATTLQASRGSISTMTRFLERPGIIDRVSKAGDRKVYYRNRPDGWYLAMKSRQALFQQMRQLAERGLEIVESDDPEVRRGLEDMLDFYAFWEREAPKVLEDWRAQHLAKREKRRADEG